jgi:U3 small nucleolar RNA-associated protein 18
MNGSLRAATFSADGRTLWSVGGDAQVYTWDVASRKCISRHADAGAVHGTAIAVAPDNAHYATGY